MTLTMDETELRSFGLYINGEWVEPVDGGSRQSINPTTGRPWATVADATAADVDAAVRAAREAFETGPWSRLTGRDRAVLLRRLGDVITAHADELSQVETLDNGKLLKEMSGQVAALPAWYDYYAGMADKIQGATIPTDKPNFFAYTVREPLGVVGAIVPWNSPLLLMAWKLAPALAAGCTFVVKPAEQAPASILIFADLMAEAGFPPGVFNVVTGDGPGAGRPLAEHPGIDKLTFTGSTAVGAEVAKAAGANLIPVGLELGGKSPHVVFNDADLDAAVNGALAGIVAAGGQTCVAGSRMLVERAVYDDFLSRLSDQIRTVRIGDPLLDETQLGPMAFEEHLRRVENFIQVGADEGASVVVGGERPRLAGLEGGFFIEPTIFAAPSNDLRITQEEVFGPVACVIPFDSEDEAVAMANGTRFGLAAGIWTRDIGRAHRLVSRVKAGTVWVNAYRTITYSVPFGGYGDSGFGRENGQDAVYDFTQTKAVWIETEGTTRDPFKLG